MAPDGLPFVDRAPGWDNDKLVTGGAKKGILLRPNIGKAIADLIIESQTCLPVAAFAPERFARVST